MFFLGTNCVNYENEITTISLNELEVGSGEHINISKEFLGDINKEYQNFINNKLTHIKTIKDYQQKLISQIDDIKLPSLEHYLSRMFASSASKENTCEFCNYVAKNVRALTAHHRGCALKKQHEAKKKEQYVYIHRYCLVNFLANRCCCDAGREHGSMAKRSTNHFTKH